MTGGVVRDYNEDDYREFWQGSSRSILDRLEQRLLARLLPDARGWFLDLGAGFGRLAPVYSIPGRRAVLVDYAVNLLEMAARDGAGSGDGDDRHFVAANAYKLPFRDGVFDAGLCVRVFHHINAPESFLGEFSRVFRGGSQAVLSYSNKRNLLRMVGKGRTAFVRDHEAFDDMLFGTHPRHFRALAEGAGFTVRATEGVGFLDQMVRNVPALDRLIAGNRGVRAVVEVLEIVASLTLGRLGVAPIHLSRLEKRQAPGAPPGAGLMDILACPRCRHPALEEGQGEIVCPSCARAFPKLGRILDLREE